MRSRIKIKNSEIQELLGSEPVEFPKYSTQIINLANQNAQGTRPAVVGQMSELIQEFTGKSITEWEEWYLKRHPDAIDKATTKISEMVENFRSVIEKIDKDMVKDWVKDLVIIKTFIGLKFQEAILSKTAKLLRTSYRLSTPSEEAKGINGYVGEIPVSIKPETYKSKKSLQENIDAQFIYYSKVKDGVTIDIEEMMSSQGHS